MKYLIALILLSSCASKSDTLVCYNNYNRLEEETGKETANFFGGYYHVSHTGGANCFVRPNE